jgi:hypothetical protein
MRQPLMLCAAWSWGYQAGVCGPKAYGSRTVRPPRALGLNLSDPGAAIVDLGQGQQPPTLTRVPGRFS